MWGPLDVRWFHGRKGTDHIVSLMFFTQQTKSNKSHHHAMPQVIAWKMDSDSPFLDNYTCTSFCLSRFHSSLFWILSIFCSIPGIRINYDLSWSSDVLYLFWITNHQRFVNTSGPYEFSKRRSAGIPKSSGSPCHPLIFQILGWIDTTMCVAPQQL